jgi:hypothetical protein
MRMTPRLSKFVLTSHISFSVGWLGAVAVFLALAITGLTTADNQLARSALLSMELSAWFVIVPFCFTSLFTGIVQAVWTKWGLFKHYWIIVKLFLTIASTILLLLHMQPIKYLASVATDPTFSNSQYSVQTIDLIAKAGAAILVLLAITTISVYKPWGRIRYSLPGNKEQYSGVQDGGTVIKKSWRFYVLLVIVILALLFIILHLVGGGMGGH